jgi:hypothetical protein
MYGFVCRKTWKEESALLEVKHRKENIDRILNKKLYEGIDWIRLAQELLF